MNREIPTIVDLAFSDMESALSEIEVLKPAEVLAVLTAISGCQAGSPRTARVRAMAIASALEGAAMLDAGLDRDYLRTPHDRVRWASILKSVVSAYNRHQYDEVRAFANGHVGRAAALWIWLHTTDRPDQSDLLLAVLRGDPETIQQVRDNTHSNVRKKPGQARPRAIPGKRILVSPRTGLTSLDRMAAPRRHAA